ncbi:thiamine/thiamine pyrophosphate ABC transporter permease ThiP [Rhodobacterales bacterium HKCCE2091]|nr:thiamine/thiamine pyrophosphate ABC transporter permease ThiP [Rhodobacterales bacterium HKCCE2091]
MASRAQPLDPVARAGIGAIGLVLAVTLLPLAAVALAAEGEARLSASDFAAIRFTVLQAALSAGLSCALAVPVARALARRRFPGRGALVTLMGAPFILPVVVAVFGLLAIFGRAGLLNAVLEAIGLPRIDIFGMTGVVLAHVFLNLPLAVRLLLSAWARIPAERLRLATALGFGPGQMERHFHWPVLREVLPGAFAAIFLICTTSFAVALILGGGPRATTVELAIYQAFRFDFDLGRAALLGLVQVAISAVAALSVLRLTDVRDLGAGRDRAMPAWPGLGRGAVVLDWAAIACAALFLVLPIALVALRGAVALPGLPGVVWAAAGRSILLALASAALATLLALAAAALMQAGRAARRGVETASFFGIAVSPLVIGTGLFLLLRPLASPEALALPVTGAVNAVAALPFILRSLSPALAEAQATQGRLAVSLGMPAWQAWRLAYLPRLARPLGFGAGLAAALSMGDLGVIALFSVTDTSTLPLEMYRLMGSYRTDDAGGAALLLLILSLGLFYLFDRAGRAG